jgi:hypothetical protein
MRSPKAQVYKEKISVVYDLKEERLDISIIYLRSTT